MLARRGWLGRDVPGRAHGWPASVSAWAHWPLLADLAVAVAHITAGVLLALHPEPGAWHALDAPGAVLTVLIGASLAARRRAPVRVLSVMLVLWVASMLLGTWPVVNSPGVLLALYTVATTTPPRTAGRAAVAVGAAWVGAGLIYWEQSNMAAVLVQAVVFPVGVVRLGRTAWQSTQRSLRLAELTRQLEAEQEARAARAVTEALTEERVRIARELHDVVAHHLSVVSLQAGVASYVFEGDPQAARGALDTIAHTGREALEELRRMLTLLRIGPLGPEEGDGAEPDGGPAPGLGRVEELLARVRCAGVPAELRWEGEPFALPPGMDLCAYRVVQEALTNVLKHAGPATVTVSVRYRPQDLTVRVADDGAGAAPAGSPTGVATGSTAGPAAGATTGHGLIGMRERSRVYRGTVTAGPRPEGGFEVLLVLPAPSPSPSVPSPVVPSPVVPDGR
ncbi:sensor histidine kinase [Kitasatospora sp. NPDC096147]|uniref:sensor histidine kinase n=1 Tax=Kitasatospora sp. NPDC096147 TaxID=3364093 RepID=UPI0037FAB86A